MLRSPAMCSASSTKRAVRTVSAMSQTRPSPYEADADVENRVTVLRAEVLSVRSFTLAFGKRAAASRRAQATAMVSERTESLMGEGHLW